MPRQRPATAVSLAPHPQNLQRTSESCAERRVHFRATRKAEVHLWLVTKPQADLFLSLATSKHYQK
jgi:hypothetical protein